MRIRAVAVVIDGDEVLVINRAKGGEEYRVLPGGGIEGRLRLGGPESQWNEPRNRYEPAWAKIRSLTGLVPETAREAVRAVHTGL